MFSGRDGYYELTGEKDYKKAMRIVQDKYQVREGVICTAGKKVQYGMMEMSIMLQLIQLNQLIQRAQVIAFWEVCYMHTFKKK